MKGKKKGKKEWLARSVEEVADFFSIGYGTARDWRKGGMPGATAKYNLSEIFRWYREREERRRGVAKGKEKQSVYDRYKGLRMRLLYLKDKGSLILRADHENLFLSFIAALKDSLERLAITFSAQAEELPMGERLRWYRVQFDQALNELAKNGGNPRKKTRKKR